MVRVRKGLGEKVKNQCFRQQSEQGTINVLNTRSIM